MLTVTSTAALALTSTLTSPTLSLIQVVLCIGTTQIVLCYILIRHIDARLARLDRKLGRVDLVAEDESGTSTSLRGPRVQETEEDEDEDAAASVIEPFTYAHSSQSGQASHVASPIASCASSSASGSASGMGMGYDVRASRYTNDLGLSLTTHRPAHALRTSSQADASWTHMPTPVVPHYSRTYASPVYALSSSSYDRPALHRSQSHSDPITRPYRSLSPTSVRYTPSVPSPLSRHCSLPCSPSYNYPSSSYSTGTSTRSPAGSSRCSTPAQLYPTHSRARETEVYSTSCPVSPCRPSSASATADTDGPMMYSNAKLSFRRHKDAYASLSFNDADTGSDAAVAVQGRRRQSRTEWVDLPPMYDEIVPSPVGQVSRSATL